MFSATDKRSGRFEVTAQQSGEYQLCFNNHASSSNKIVSFATHIGENAPHDAATKGARNRHAAARRAPASADAFAAAPQSPRRA